MTKTVKSEAVHQEIEVDLTSSSERVSGELGGSVWFVIFTTLVNVFIAAELCLKLELQSFYFFYDIFKFYFISIFFLFQCANVSLQRSVE